MEREVEPSIPGPMTPTDFGIMRVLDQAEKPIPPRVVNDRLDEPKSQTTVQERLAHLVEKGFVEREARGKYRLANPSRKYIVWPLCFIGILAIFFALASPIYGPIMSIIGLLTVSGACFLLYLANWWLGRMYERRRKK